MILYMWSHVGNVDSKQRCHLLELTRTSSFPFFEFVSIQPFCLPPPTFTPSLQTVVDYKF